MFVRQDRRIRIEAPGVTQDAAYGTRVVGWTAFATVWAQVEELPPAAATEGVANGIRIAQRQARIRIRYLAGVTSDMRVVYLTRGGRVMKILAQPVEIGRREWLEFLVADFSTSGEAA